MYTLVHDSNFIYFLKEAEYRRNIKLLNPENKLKDFETLLETLKNGDEINNINEEDLKNLNYGAFYDD